MKKVFVIIVTYKGKQWYDRCFQSLRESTYPVTTIVVDNASNDGSVEYIREHFPEIILIESKENLGFGKGNNLAMRYALDHDCDYVFLLNQDTWLCEYDAIEKLVKIAEQHPEYGIISPLHVKSDEKTLGMMLEYQTNRTSMALLTDLLKNEPKVIYPTNYINAAAWLLPRKTLEVVGGFDPIFIHYAEDDNYLQRVLFHKMLVGVVPSICIVHDHRKDTVNPLTPQKSRLRKLQEILVRLTNINNDLSVNQYLLHELKCLLRNICVGKWKRAKDLIYDMHFIYQHRYAIKMSRKNNVKKQLSWLE